MSSISHFVGAVVFLVLAVFLLASSWGNHRRFLLFLLFSVSGITLLTLSGVYHMLQLDSTARAVLLRLDVAAIFVLIASTFSPIHGILFEGWRRWGILIPLWTVAAFGITLRSIFFETVPQWLGTTIFLAMGWIGVISTILIWRRFRWQVLPIVIGGVLYSAGALLNLFQWPTVIPAIWGPHECFHLVVLAGLGCHWQFISQIADGKLVDLRPDVT